MNHKFLPHLYQTIAEEAVFGIVVFNQKEECLFSNNAANFALHTDQPDLAQIVPSETQGQLKPFTRELLHHDGFYQDIVMANADGGTFIANLGIRFVQVDHQSAHLIIFQDITIQKKLQREILAKQMEINSAYEDIVRQNRMLKQLDSSKDRFIALTTHELRTPLAAMVSAAEILKLGLYDNDQQMKEFIDLIYEQGLQLQDLVNDILDFAKIQAGKMDFYLEKKDPFAVLQSVVRNFEGMAETSQVKLYLHAPSQPLPCYFDEVRLRQIVSNIINNAIKYNRLNGRVDVTIEDTGERVRISVKDTGQGIAKDQFDKVFNEFETIGHVAHHHQGTGLGMPISRKLAEGMGGSVTLESEVNIGSVFSVELTKQKVLADHYYRARAVA